MCLKMTWNEQINTLGIIIIITLVLIPRWTLIYYWQCLIGSPYAIDVKVPSHGTGIVYVHGPGIQTNGVLGQYESHFWVDARDAGSGELNVSVLGPKGITFFGSVFMYF